MSTSIFIKTWKNDVEWMLYSLESIKKYGSNIDEIVIAADLSCYEQVISHWPVLEQARVVAVSDWPNGYIQQQWIKLNAHKYTNSDFILYVDSDCIFHTEFTPASFMTNGNPILLKTNYSKVGDAICWKAITEELIRIPLTYEYMRRLPAMYRRESLIAFHAQYPNLETKLLLMQDRAFSEFNALGAYIDMYEPYRYSIIDTDDHVPEAVAKQFWSWGGLTEEVQEEIKGYLNAT